MVGDDQQAIYQWRGSDVSNIVTFRTAIPAWRRSRSTVNRRSRPRSSMWRTRSRETIPERIVKTMTADRACRRARSRRSWRGRRRPRRTRRAGSRNLVLDLADAGVRFADIAVLVRSRAAYARLVEQFGTFDIPVQPGGRSGLFDQPEAVVARSDGRLADRHRMAGASHEPGATVSDDRPAGRLPAGFPADTRPPAAAARVPSRVEGRGAAPDRTADLVGELYELLGRARTSATGTSSDPHTVNRLGTLARFSSLLADYESVRRRARPDADAPGEQVGGQDRGTWYYRNLALHIINYAQGAYEGFDGEADFVLDAVDLTTVHRAKGLEWPVVFVPSVTASRFPILPHRPGAGLAGSAGSLRRARATREATPTSGGCSTSRMTRARDWLSVSRHAVVKSRPSPPAPTTGSWRTSDCSPKTSTCRRSRRGTSGADDPIAITFSELAAFLDCGLAFRLRELIGFQPRLAPELGYGKAVHHVMRAVAEATRATGWCRRPGRSTQSSTRASSCRPRTSRRTGSSRDAARRLVMTYAETARGRPPPGLGDRAARSSCTWTASR